VLPPVALQPHRLGSTGAGGLSLTTVRSAARLPEPGRFWIRYAPRTWEGPQRPWLDLAAGRLGRSGRQAPAAAEPAGRPGAGGHAVSLIAGDPPAASAPGQAASPDSDRPPGAGDRGEAASTGTGDTRPGLILGDFEPPIDDLLYLPPVPERLAASRDALARRALAGGAPVLLQLLPGDTTSLAAGDGAVLVVDLLAALLAGGLERLAALPAAATAAVWPLLPGITDDPDLWERGCRRLAGAGLVQLQALVPVLGPGDRRRLAAGLGEEAFEALFHRQPPAERDLARAAHRHGLAPFLPRPLPRPPLSRAGNRRIAGLLALAAELWLRVGRPVEPAQSLFRAARWLDSTAYDVDALSREGNLAVVTALDPLARRAVAEATGGGEPALVAELLAEYLS
jgi:hypothetical protein